MRSVSVSAVLTIVVMLWSGIAQAVDNATLYAPYQQLLNKFLVERDLPDNGLVSAFDYDAAVNHDGAQALIANQRQALTDLDLSSLESRQESVAFWINAYNFFMLKQILTDRPQGRLVSSVWDYGGRINPFVDSVFEKQKFVIGGHKFSLSEIEKEILLGEDYTEKGWKDARVHFAVNCASVGCPPLRKMVYTADNLEQLLAENTRRALGTQRHLEVEGNTLRVTELFKWYAKDFEQASGSRKDFIKSWVDSALAARISATSELAYIDYDWDLNRPDNFPELQ